MSYNFSTINTSQQKITIDSIESNDKLLDEEIAEIENGQVLELEDKEET